MHTADSWAEQRDCVAEYRAVTTLYLRRLIRVNARVIAWLSEHPNATLDEYIAWRDSQRLISYRRALSKIGLAQVKRDAEQAYHRQVLAIYDRLTTI